MKDNIIFYWVFIEFKVDPLLFYYYHYFCLFGKTMTKHWIKGAMWSHFPQDLVRNFLFSCFTFVEQKKPNDDAGTSHSETSKKRKVFQKVENSCMDPVLKDSNGLPSASMTERLAESMDLTKSQVIKMIKFSPFGLDIFTLFSSSSIHPAFIWWFFFPVWRFSNQTAWKEFWNFNVAWQASQLELLSKLFCDEIAEYPKEFSCSWMAVILVWGAQYVGEKLNDKVTRRWSKTVIDIIENGWNRLAFH